MSSDIEIILDHYGIYYTDKPGEQSIHCPVHEDAQASASLHLDKEVFNCHACGASGSAYDIVMKREDMEFAPARAFVERITGRKSGGRDSKTTRPVAPGTGYRPRQRRRRKVGARIQF